MSIHANQARLGGPSSSGAPAGANPTYKTHVQRDRGVSSKSAKAGDGKRRPDLSQDGAKRTTKTTEVHGDSTTGANVVGGFGDGHYKKA